MPFARQLRADEEEGFTLTLTSSYAVVTVSSEDGNGGPGTADVAVGDVRPVFVSVIEHIWEEWTGDVSGVVEIRNEHDLPKVVSLDFTVESGPGSITPATVQTSALGEAQATFTMGAGDSTVRVSTVEAAGGQPALGTISFMREPETYSYTSSEGLLTATLTTTGTTEDVQPDETRPVKASVIYESWEVWTSNFGNTEIQFYNKSPAVGALLTWTVESGDGSVDIVTSETNTGGEAATVLTMGQSASVVRADVSYGGSCTAFSTLGFAPHVVVENFELAGYETHFDSLTLSADADTSHVPPGSLRTLQAAVAATDWEVWIGDLGSRELRNPLPAASTDGSIVTFNIAAGGDGVLGDGQPPLTTLAAVIVEGVATASFTMGLLASSVTASVGGVPNVASATLDITPTEEVWGEPVGTGGARVITLSAAVPGSGLSPEDVRSLTAHVSDVTWNVYNGDHGHTKNDDYSYTPVSGEWIYFQRQSGDGRLTYGTQKNLPALAAVTDSSGNAMVTYVMGLQATSIRVVDACEFVDWTSDPFVFYPTSETWTKTRNETTIAVSTSCSGDTTRVIPGTTRACTAHVSYEAWELWTGSLGHTVRRNQASGPAIGATVAFSVDQGDGSIPAAPATAATDASGNASVVFTMGSQPSRLRADVSYATATSAGTLNFNPGAWVHDHDDRSLTVEMSGGMTGTNAGTVTATATYSTWEVWVNGTVESKKENETSTPAGNAAVTFSVIGGNGTVSPASTTASLNGTTMALAGVANGSSATIRATVSYSGLTTSADMTLSSAISQTCGCANTASCPGAGCTDADAGAPACACGGDGGDDDGGDGTQNDCACSNVGCPKSTCTTKNAQDGCNCCGCGNNNCPGFSCAALSPNHPCTCGYPDPPLPPCAGCTNQVEEGGPGTCPGDGCLCAGNAGCDAQSKNRWYPNSHTVNCDVVPGWAMPPSTTLNWEEYRIYPSANSRSYSVTKFRRLSWSLSVGSSDSPAAISGSSGGSIRIGDKAYTIQSVNSRPNYIQSVWKRGPSEYHEGTTDRPDIVGIEWNRAGILGGSEIEGTSVKMNFNLLVGGNSWNVNYMAPMSGTDTTSPAP